VSEQLAAVLDGLVPPSDGLPGGGSATAALLADPEAAPLMAALEPRSGESPPQAWQRFAGADPQAASALLHLLTAAYFTHPAVRAHHRLDRTGRPNPGGERLAALLADVPPAPRLPERTP
jgi:hypothetical protein